MRGIPWNPDSETITVTTDSVAGSKAEHVSVFFFDKDGYYAGDVYIHFDTQIQYRIGYCTYRYKPFPVILPTATQKTWTITYNYAERRLVYYCNGVQVLNVVLSDSTCTKWSTNSFFKDLWERKPTQIQFYYTDVASDSYCISSNTGKYNGLMGVIDPGSELKLVGDTFGEWWVILFILCFS